MLSSCHKLLFITCICLIDVAFYEPDLDRLESMRSSSGVGKLCRHNFEHNRYMYAFENHASIIGINRHNFENLGHNIKQCPDYILLCTGKELIYPLSNLSTCKTEIATLYWTIV